MADRLFGDFKKAFHIVSSTQNSKEMICDIVTLPDVVVNFYNLDFGHLQDGRQVDSLLTDDMSTSQFLLLQQAAFNSI